MKLLGLFLIRCVFTKKTSGRPNLLKPEPERIEAFRNTVQCRHRRRHCRRRHTYQTTASSSSRTHTLWVARPAPYPLLRRNFLKKGPKMT